MVLTFKGELSGLKVAREVSSATRMCGVKGDAKPDSI